MASVNEIQENAAILTEAVEGLQERVAMLNEQLARMAEHADVAGAGSHDFLLVGLTVFVLAVFVGYHVVWNVTPALHSPLMGVTNAISSVIIVGALIATGPEASSFSKVMGFLAVVLASINIFGGFIVTQRMLSMFKKKR